MIQSLGKKYNVLFKDGLSFTSEVKGIVGMIDERFVEEDLTIMEMLRYITHQKDDEEEFVIRTDEPIYKYKVFEGNYKEFCWIRNMMISCVSDHFHVIDNDFRSEKRAQIKFNMRMRQLYNCERSDNPRRIG
jgi:hypothetical protein